MKQNLTATKVLIGINVIAFLLWNQLARSPQQADPFSLYLFENENFRVWQFLTSMFMHANFSHLLMNMFGLFMFGEVLERMWGSKRFVFFYLITGLGAGLIYSGVTTFEVHSGIQKLVEQGFQPQALERGMRIAEGNAALMTMIQGFVGEVTTDQGKQLAELYLNFNTRVVGASGAIYGILTAFGLLFPNAKLALIFLPVPVAAKYFIPGLLLLDLFSGVTGFSIFGGGIAHFAHLGGALIGFLLMLYWRNLAKPLPQNLQGFTA